MNFVGDWILMGFVALGLIPIGVIAIESVASLWPLRDQPLTNATARPRCALLIPAHNEESGIAATIASLTSQIEKCDRIIVIADNCSDLTAQVAREAGAEAIERHDAERRGKGFALAFGLKHLESHPPEIVVLIDADTRALPNALEWLIRTVVAKQTPMQGVFTDSPKKRGLREQWSAFALVFKNFVRPLGLSRLRLPCLLTGSGMAFPWPILRRAELGTGNIVEDMQLGIDLALAGHPPRFCPEARFESDDAPTLQAAVQRRTRWEHGHIATMLKQAPRLAWAGVSQLRPRLLALALELSVPPLSLLFVAEFFLLAVCYVWWQFDGDFLPFTVLTIGGAIGVATIFAVWLRFGRSVLTPKILFFLPIYILWKVPIYLKLVVAPQRNWVRTERNPSS